MEYSAKGKRVGKKVRRQGVTMITGELKNKVDSIEELISGCSYEEFIIPRIENKIGKRFIVLEIYFLD